MSVLLIKHAGEEGGHIVGSVKPAKDGGLPVDVCLTVGPTARLDGIAIADWPEGIHDLSDDPDLEPGDD